MNIIDKVKKVSHNKEGKILIENFLSLSVLQGISFIFPLLTYPYLARVIGVANFGEIAFAMSIVVYFDTLIAYGFNYTGARDVAQNKDDLTIVSEIYSRILCAKFLLFILSLSLFTTLIFIIPEFYNKRLILFLTFLYVPGSMIFPEWLFQGLQKMKFITILNFISKLLFTILVFLLIKEERDYVLQPVIIALGYFVSGVLSIIIAVKKLKVRFIKPNIKDTIKLIQKNFSMFLTVFLPNLYSNFSVTLLGMFRGTFATGIYASGKKFTDICETFLSVLSRTFFPFLARRGDKHKVYVKISGIFSVIMGICLFLGASIIIRVFYGDAFSEAILVLKIMSISPFFLFLMNAYGTNYLVLKGREDILRNIVVFCSLFGFVLAWYAVKNHGYIGVAYTVTAVRGIRGVLTWYCAKRLKNVI